MLLAAVALPAQTVWQLFTESGSASSFVGSNVGKNVTVSIPANSAVTIYTSGFDAVALALGEKYSLSFNFSSTGGISGANAGNRIIGIGLFDSKGTETFTDDQGLMAWVRSDMSVELREKRLTAEDESLLKFGAYTFYNLGTGTGGSTASLADDTNYAVSTFQIDYTGSGYRFGTHATTNPGVVIEGEGFSRSLYTNPGEITSGLTFNLFAVYFWNTSGSAVEFTISDVSLAAAAIPEPSTCAAWLGLAVLGLAAWSRRMRARR